jgi:hypothetical protein
MLLPATVLIDKEKLSLRAILGTLVSIGGVAAMFVL